MPSGQSSRVRSTPLGLQKLKEAKDSQHGEHGKRLTFERIAEESYVSLSRVKAFFRGQAVYRDNAKSISQVLGLELADIIEPSEAALLGENLRPNTTFLIDWQTFQEKLDQRQRLTTNPLTGGSGMRFNSKDIYVPLGLVERKQKSKRSGDILPETGSNVSQPTEYEITRNFERDEFFEQVLKLGESPKSQGRCIAIIGEPGAGKTTRLQQIADWVFEETDGDVAIWVSLADLQGRSLEEYLLQVWLKDALKTARVTPEMEDALVESFNRGQVWLLLDGVDEMGVENPLQAIARHLRGWIAEARVILTCRVNVWDAGKNALEDQFDVYRNLDFNLEQVNQFIDKWFANTPEQGQLLKTELEQAGKERIRDSVKNPLRLALLCRTWQQREGALPETKAALYRQFTEALYQWKEESFPTTSAQRQELEAALGRLAKGAIARPTSRFRLTRRQVCETLGETDAPLFQLASNLGWLNQVGVAAENPDEPVYAFYHPTFEEYFAALAIDDWHFFLNHVPQNPARGTYRIFEPQWKEVILLWLGREDVDKDVKEQFISHLVEFEDNSGGFYKMRSYFLAVAVIAEFKDCIYAARLIEWVVSISFGKFSRETNEWENQPYPRALAAQAALLQTDRSRALNAMIDLLNSEGAWYCHQKVAEILSKISPGNPEAITALLELRRSRPPREVFQYYELNDYSYLDFMLNAANSLKMFAPDNKENNEIIDKYKLPILTNSRRLLIDFFHGEINKLLNVNSFEEVNHEAIPKLIELLNEKYDEKIQLAAVEGLMTLDEVNDNVITALNELLNDKYKEQVRLKAAEQLRYINNADSNNNVINMLIELLKNSQNQQTRWDAAKILLNYLSGFRTVSPEVIYRHPELINQVVESLVELLQTALNDEIRLNVLEKLCEIAPYNPNVTERLVELLIEMVNTSENDKIRVVAADTLCQVTGGNEDAVVALIKVIYHQDDNIFREANRVLRKIRLNNLLPLIVTGLKDSAYYLDCYSTLWDCAQNMTYPDFYRAWHSQPTTPHPEVPDTTEVGTNSLTLSLNFSYLSQSLHSRINLDSQVGKKVKLICIDGSKFIDPDNPASRIYTEMVKGGCPKSDDGIPKTMQELQAYWALLTLESDKQIILVFYHLEKFSPIFLEALSKFDGTLCVVTGEQSENSFLQQFSANQPQLVENIVGWIRARVLENGL